MQTRSGGSALQRKGCRISIKNDKNYYHILNASWTRYYHQSI